jgi:hypothetical protein
MSRRRTLTIGFAIILILVVVFSIVGNSRFVQRRARQIEVRVHQLEFDAQRWNDDSEVTKRDRDEGKFIEDVNSGKIVAIKCPIASESSGDWMRKVEAPIAVFARSNHIQILRFRTWPNTNTDVCVWKKDAPRVRSFVESLTNETQGGGK